MSNCIELLERVVKLTSDELDVPKFKAQWERSNVMMKCHPSNEEHTEQEVDDNCFWWYLGGNVHFDKDGGVTISFGQGRSSHTWRDFAWVCETMRKFMLKSHKHTFVISDTDWDDGATSYRQTIEFKPYPPLVQMPDFGPDMLKEFRRLLDELLVKHKTSWRGTRQLVFVQRDYNWRLDKTLAAGTVTYGWKDSHGISVLGDDGSIYGMNSWFPLLWIEENADATNHKEA